MKIDISEGAVYGRTYYCVEPPRVWWEMESWVQENFGPGGGYNSDQRWYKHDHKFWFRDERDRVLFLLRWS